MIGDLNPVLGRLERVDLRAAWTGEATAFTPWLAQPDNIALLGEAIGIELEVDSQEKDVGPFRADILCRDTVNNQFVLIENQLERTDHGHLGQLVTYAAGLDAVTIIWIASRFTDEHRAALDWLNSATKTGINFFGIEIELWRIGASPMAPQFNVVSQPNDWSKAVRQQASNSQATPMSEFQRLHLEFWTQFRQFLDERGSPIRTQRPSTDHWTNVAIGRSYFQLAATNGMRDNNSAISLNITGPDAKAHFKLIERRYRAKVEERLAPVGTVEWRLLPEKRESNIKVSRPSIPSDRGLGPSSINGWQAALKRWPNCSARLSNRSTLETWSGMKTDWSTKAQMRPCSEAAIFRSSRWA